MIGPRDFYIGSWYDRDYYIAYSMFLLDDLLQLTDWKHERLNTPTSQQNTWTPVLNFIEIYM